MIFSTTATLDAVRPFVPRALVEDRAWARMVRAASGLPEAMVSHTLECRLAAAPSQVDYLACATVRAGSPARLADPALSWSLAPSLLAHPAWGRVQSLLEAWAAERDMLGRDIPIIWLEFDLEAGGPEHPVPRVGLCVDPTLAGGPAVPPIAFEASLKRALGLLRGGPLSPAALRVLQRAVDALPGTGRAVHFGVAPASPSELLRCVPELPATEVPAYLAAMGWRGDARAPREVLHQLCLPRGGKVKIDVDVRDGELQPKFAAFTELWHEGARMREVAGPLLEQLVARGLCSAQKAEALVHWPGDAEVTLEGLSWPVTLHRSVDLKVVVSPDGRTEAKAYLALAAHLALF